jgi:hypothetical protein
MKIGNFYLRQFVTVSFIFGVIITGCVTQVFATTENQVLLKKRRAALAKTKVAPLDNGPTLEDQIQDSFYDPNFNYAEFTGRVTDRDDTSSIIKISSENRNIKFFRSGDLVRFRLASKDSRDCRGYVRSVEKGYFVLYVQDITLCWGAGKYFRRGSMLVFSSDTLAARVRDASTYRIVLLKRRRDFYKQLNDVNHFVWSYEQERVQLAAEYDEKITALRQAKQKAMDMLATKKKDSINLQRELAYRLDQLDRNLEYYRIDKDEPKIDRWHLDHDLGKPVQKRPKTTFFSN